MPSARAIRVALTAAVCAAALTAWATPAFANAPYDVELCTPKSSTDDGISFTSTPPAGFHTFPCGNPIDGGIRLEAGDTVERGSVQWFLRTPPGTVLHRLFAERDFLAWNKSVKWEVFTDSPQTFDTVPQGSEPLQSGRLEYPAESGFISGALECSGASSSCNGTPGSSSAVTLEDVVAHMEDTSPPVAKLLFIDHGVTENAEFIADDVGAGLKRVTLLVGGQRQKSMTDDNNGRCETPYKFFSPCVPGMSGFFPIDTTALSDGEHKVQIEAEDGSGQRSISTEETITVHQRPVNTMPPTITGSSRFGGTLTANPGTWEGDPTFDYLWLRCSPRTGACNAIPGQTGTTYSPTTADASQSIEVDVFGSNQMGQVSARSAPTATLPADRTPPSLTRPSLSPKRFHVAKASHGKAAKKARAGGTTLRLTSSEPVTLSIQVGALHGKKLKRVGKFGATVAAGPVKVLISGRIGKRALAPGAYRMTITATDASGNASKPLVRPFTVLPG